MLHISDMASAAQNVDLRSQVLRRTAEDPSAVWTPGDFADLAGRAAIDKTLQRLATSGDLRRIDRGLYDRPGFNQLTGKQTVPNYRAVIQAVARRDNVRFVVDGMTAANDLGLTTAVPAKIEVLVDSRLKPIKLGNQKIRFKHAAVSRLTWADRPGMRVVQALYWLQDILPKEGERDRIASILRRVFADPKHGQAIRDDLRRGVAALPIWMQEFLRPLLFDSEEKAS
jgi:Family of unknown function (DUF6088)